MNFYEIALIALGILMIGGLLRVIKGPTIWDRLLGYNLVASKITIAIILFAVILDKTYILDMAILYALLGFISIIMIARFIERKGDV